MFPILVEWSSLFQAKATTSHHLYLFLIDELDVCVYAIENKVAKH